MIDVHGFMVFVTCSQCESNTISGYIIASLVDLWFMD